MNAHEALPKLAKQAWRVRDNARLYGKTKVGAAALSSGGCFYVGCNIEHRFRAHGIHAEVNALSEMVANEDGTALAIVIAAERAFFTPCGGCMDWIFELGSPGTIVGFSGDPADYARLTTFTASDLMPHYPH